MKTMKNIFAKIFITGVMLGCVLVMPVCAAVSNGCENPNNDYIVPSLALCSTHVYNIGDTKNPTYETRSIMQDVIALKTTVIAQQMYKQYEYLEAMIRRLKTQLEKATLTASLQAAGAKSSSDGTESDVNWKDKDRDIFMDDGITNCKTKYGNEERFNCYKSNIEAIDAQSNNGKTPNIEMKKQLVREMENMNKTWDEKCKNDGCTSNSMNTKTFEKCLDKARECLHEVKKELDEEKQKNALYPRY